MLNLRDIAAADCQKIIENSASGFGWPLIVTDPAGTTAELTGFSNDVAESIDPETGLAISGRVISVALNIRTLSTAGLGMPEGISDSASKPWVIEFTDINGFSGVYKVQRSNPDRALGLVTCLAEPYDK